MIRFITDILDVKNLLGMQRIRTLSWDKPSGTMTVQVNGTWYGTVTVRYGSIVYPIAGNGYTSHAFYPSPAAQTWYFDLQGNVQTLNVNGTPLV